MFFAPRRADFQPITPVSSSRVLSSDRVIVPGCCAARRDLAGHQKRSFSQTPSPRYGSAQAEEPSGRCNSVCRTCQAAVGELANSAENLSCSDKKKPTAPSSRTEEFVCIDTIYNRCPEFGKFEGKTYFFLTWPKIYGSMSSYIY